MIKLIKIVILITIISLSNKAFAIDPIYTPLFSDKAIKGYDTVAYFTEGKPVKGSTVYSTKYMEATWLFSSRENLDLFLSQPEKYAPQYGGYCAYAVSQNTTASIKPELFTIHQGKLYLNYDERVNSKWRQDKANFISDADANWPKILND